MDIKKLVEDIETARDATHGKGHWHCDDILDDPDAPACVRAFLAHARAPAHGMLIGKVRPPLFAASRFGDVGITDRRVRLQRPRPAADAHRG